MKWLLLAGVVIVAGLIVRALHRHQTANSVSVDWLYQQARRDEQNTFEGPSIRWPIKKIINETSSWQTRLLRRKSA